MLTLNQPNTYLKFSLVDKPGSINPKAPERTEGWGLSVLRVCLLPCSERIDMEETQTWKNAQHATQIEIVTLAKIRAQTESMHVLFNESLFFFV